MKDKLELLLLIA